METGLDGDDGAYTRPDRLAVYAYMKTDNLAFADEAIKELTARASTAEMETGQITGPEVVLNPIIETWRVNTNQAAQWSLNVIEIFEMVSDQIPRRALEG